MLLLVLLFVCLYFFFDYGIPFLPDAALFCDLLTRRFSCFFFFLIFCCKLNALDTAVYVVLIAIVLLDIRNRLIFRLYAEYIQNVGTIL